jgi:uroporphyrinogen decarboxylase
MTSAEKFQNCLDVKPVNDRREIPVYPQLVSFPGIFAGISLKEEIDSPKRWMESLRVTFDHFGRPDVAHCVSLGDVIFSEGLESRRPGYELPDNTMFQLIESERMDHDDYRNIVQNGWDQWLNRYYCSLQRPPFKSNFRLILRWIKFGMNCGKIVKFLRGMGVEPIAGTAAMPTFDQLSLIRSFVPFCMDLYDVPELVHDVLRTATPSNIKLILTNLKRSSVGRAQVYAMRSDANSISPEIFDEFAFPYLKQTLDAIYRAGYRTVLHADGDWLPMLDRFLDFPKGSIHFEFDDVTDIPKAAAILDGRHSLRGNVPASMFAFGTADDVSAYCEKLIESVGMKGGFMLGSGCEIPLNCKPENLTAMINAVR